MEFWQMIIVAILGFVSLLAFVKGLHESVSRKNAFGEAYYLLPIGAFVWGDAVVFGLFWLIVSLIILFLKNWLLFLLILSIFWVVRSFKESIWFMNHQFSQDNQKRYPAKKFYLFKFLKNDSVFFISQIIWQCLTVFFIIMSIVIILRLF